MKLLNEKQQIKEESQNSFLAYTDENNPANILLSALFAQGYLPEDMDFENFAELNEFCVELVPDPELTF